jgi:YebC/PmpR family DNA-binding regulatory protein
MAGHNKWSKVKHRKAVVDSRRSKVWSKCAKAIMVAARHGGSDPESNLSLRYAIDEARYANMPRDTIERAIKKGAGELGTESWENIRYEGYGPGGVAIVIDALTNNRTRTAVEVRNAFAKYGGNLGTTGCVGFMFSTVGQIAIDLAKEPPTPTGPGPKTKPPVLTGDMLMEAAIDAGAADVSEPSGEDHVWTVTTDPTEFHRIKDALEKRGFQITEAGIVLMPTTTADVRGDLAKSVMKLIDALEDDDDVQKVYSNAEIPDEELAAME